jgi:hypothetical protein
MAQKEGNATLPDVFDLVVVSMLNNLKPSEAEELAAETKYFASLPSPGGAPGNGSKLVHWPIIGDIVSPHASITKAQCLQSAAQYDTRPDHMVRGLVAVPRRTYSFGPPACESRHLTGVYFCSARASAWMDDDSPAFSLPPS